MRIVVATDLTARSDRAVGRGYLMARQLGAELALVHVVDAAIPGDQVDHSAEWAREALEAVQARAGSETGIKAELIVRAGDPTELITHYADESGTDLLIMGVHVGTGVADKPFAGTTAGRILRSSLAACLLVRDPPERHYGNAVVGVDFSASSRAGIRQAARLVPAACLHLVHAFVVPFKGRFSSEAYVDETAYEERLALDDFLRDEMAGAQRIAAEAGVIPGRLDIILREGVPEEVLRSVRKVVDGDLIVIATHSRSALSRAVWGSVAADLLEHPPCDVLVVKPY